MTGEAWIVFDLGFGDAGKGATVDFLVRDRAAELVVRFNGGAQAGHNVVTPDGRHHTFAQFGSGSFLPGTKTLLGPAFVFHPSAFLVEAEHLRSVGVDDALARTSIDARALVISPFQQAAGRLRELRRGSAAHGTCGVGVGEAVMDAVAAEADVLRVADLDDVDQVSRKLKSQRRRKSREFNSTNIGHLAAAPEINLLHDRDAVDRALDQWSPLRGSLIVLTPRESHQLIRHTRTIIFEGAQGVLLDQDVGFHPHTTWSDCTPRSAVALSAGMPHRVFRLGVTRAFSVRHGPGPFPTADPAYDHRLPEPHNNDHGWQGRFRRGPLDLVLLRYAVPASGGCDGLAINALDTIGQQAELCRSYEFDGQTVTQLVQPSSRDLSTRRDLGDMLHRAKPIIELIDSHQLRSVLESELDVPIWITSTGPTANDRIWVDSPLPDPRRRAARIKESGGSGEFVAS